MISLSTVFQHRFKVVILGCFISGVCGYLAYRQGLKQQKKREKLVQNDAPHKNYMDIIQSLNSSRAHSQAGHEQQQHELAKQFSLYGQFYFDKDKSIRQVLDKLDNQGINVQNIYKYSPIIAVQEFNKFNIEIRHRRRLIRTINEDQYVYVVMDYEREIDQLLERSRLEIIEECEIDPQEFERMKQSFQCTEDLAIIMRNARTYLKDLSSSKNRTIPLKILQKIISEQVFFVKSKIYDRLRNKLQDKYDMAQDDILKIIQTLLDDILYQKFGYEREQIMIAIQKQRFNINSQIKEWEQNMEALKSDIGNFQCLLPDSDEDNDYQSFNKKNSSQVKTRSQVSSNEMEEDD